MFPQGLIDQWLSKSREGRRSVREDRKATPAILDNIDRLEEYCRSHPYNVFCASTLQHPPFALHALESEAAAQQRLAQPPPVFAATVPSPSAHTTASNEVWGGVCGRYADGDESRASVAAARQHLHNVAARLATYLQSSGAVRSSATRHEEESQCTVVADFFVHLLSEAAVAAVYRQGIAAQVEGEERAAFQHRQSRRRLQLPVHSKHDGTLEGLELSDRKGAGAEAVHEVEGLTVVRPIADYRRLSQGLASLWSLLAQTERRGGLAPGGPPSKKRSRDSTADTDSADDNDNLWTRVRVDYLRHWLGDRPLPPPPPLPGTAALGETQRRTEASSPANLGGAWRSRPLYISERDVEFALRKVLADVTASAPP
ncbi:conserved hypothetical protein [Leishmania mexicana MHOM/GT/2001/U1103]|uniref:Uncharacterized protein n=1 Tax=Leishmania mexicana (strain MHOM/GT/2001/U1103) TaxID=929439 RepID=E9AMR9_LEIMU|nr:conserved hypothetical protein [Leishmania mexicana MHOM/GT/2001/U1103]CBZ24224.1 conserved hypothetical protein [Leishmania mexicana MHOM/GT/2001/U1103]